MAISAPACAFLVRRCNPKWVEPRMPHIAAVMAGAMRFDSPQKGDTMKSASSATLALAAIP